ncbi:MAG TPA: hypothetical protein P5260_14190 [Candidatus Competibacter sp.]|jgi:hypothetical protein|nr:hypothetical protein [Candidatus Competibacter sp.]HRX62344.1 hypothetical protein [Candidatus Competibacter sp.]
MLQKKLLQGGFWAAVAGAGMLVSGGLASAAGVDMYDGQWHYSLTPYAWFPNIHQTLQYSTPLGGGKTVDVEVKPDSYLSNLDFALMGTFEARKGDWALAMDLIYNDFSNQDSKIRNVQGPGGNLSLPIDTSLNVDIKALIWEGIGSYTVARSATGTLDVFGGVRYLGLKTSTDLSFSGPEGIIGRSGSQSNRLNVWDGIIGVRGEVKIGDSGDWFLPYYLDIGAGSHSNWTWQGWTGVGYRFDWGDVVLAYRNLYYSTDEDKVIEDLRMAGPALGATFRW